MIGVAFLIELISLTAAEITRRSRAPFCTRDQYLARLAGRSDLRPPAEEAGCSTP